MKFKMPRPRIVCRDGVSLSVQASSMVYATPREDKGPYTHVEVGFIEGAIPPETWLEYADECKIPSDIYGYIPIELVEAFIAEHGGIDLGKSI